MTCDDVQHRLLEGALGPGDDEHVGACEACRALRDAHGAALGLRALEPRGGTRVPRAAVVKRAGLVLAVVVGVVTGGLLRGERSAPVAPRAHEGAATHDEEWAAFVAFTRGLEQDLSRDVSTADPLVPSQGALSSWVAPASTLSSLSLEN